MGESRPARSRPLLLLLGIWLGGAALAAVQGETSEVIELVALEDIVLVSPSSQLAVRAEPIGALVAGQTVRVLSCSPRKTHTDIEVLFNEAAAIVWKGGYRLERRRASGREAHATPSCSGVASH
ncbi:MAG: hypothetical protein JWQ33_2057 [Ramlibacter sp.]|nr:hypothetical protein [Ramlibacter sp.]